DDLRGLAAGGRQVGRLADGGTGVAAGALLRLLPLGALPLLRGLPRPLLGAFLQLGQQALLLTERRRERGLGTADLRGDLLLFGQRLLRRRALLGEPFGRLGVLRQLPLVVLGEHLEARRPVDDVLWRPRRDE